MLYNDNHQQIVTENSLGSIDMNMGAVARTPMVAVYPGGFYDRYIQDNYMSEYSTRTYMGGYGTGDFSTLWWGVQTLLRQGL